MERERKLELRTLKVFYNFLLKFVLICLFSPLPPMIYNCVGKHKVLFKQQRISCYATGQGNSFGVGSTVSISSWG